MRLLLREEVNKGEDVLSDFENLVDFSLHLIFRNKREGGSIYVTHIGLASSALVSGW